MTQTTRNGENILHIACQANQHMVIGFLATADERLLIELSRQQDLSGQVPLHYLVAKVENHQTFIYDTIYVLHRFQQIL